MWQHIERVATPKVLANNIDNGETGIGLTIHLRYNEFLSVKVTFRSIQSVLFPWHAVLPEHQ